MTEILLARHGETDWNRDNRFQGHADPTLNEVGRAQAEELAATLAREPIAAVYSSPLRRALETAETVSARHEPAPITVEALREVNVGSWQGLTRAEVESRFPEQFRRWLDYGPGWEDGETHEQMGERVLAPLRELDHRHPHERLSAGRFSTSMSKIRKGVGLVRLTTMVLALLALLVATGTAANSPKLRCSSVQPATCAVDKSANSVTVDARQGGGADDTQRFAVQGNNRVATKPPARRGFAFLREGNARRAGLLPERTVGHVLKRDWSSENEAV